MKKYKKTMKELFNEKQIREVKNKLCNYNLSCEPNRSSVNEIYINAILKFCGGNNTNCLDHLYAYKLRRLYEEQLQTLCNLSNFESVSEGEKVEYYISLCELEETYRKLIGTHNKLEFEFIEVVGN